MAKKTVTKYNELRQVLEALADDNEFGAVELTHFRTIATRRQNVTPEDCLLFIAKEKSLDHLTVEVAGNKYYIIPK